MGWCSVHTRAFTQPEPPIAQGVGGIVASGTEGSAGGRLCFAASTFKLRRSKLLGAALRLRRLLLPLRRFSQSLLVTMLLLLLLLLLSLLLLLMLPPSLW